MINTISWRAETFSCFGVLLREVAGLTLLELTTGLFSLPELSFTIKLNSLCVKYVDY